MNPYKKIAVLGGGSFGTVLANLAASNGYSVSLWVRDSEQALRINSEGANTTYHPELKLSENIEATDSLEEVLKDASMVFIATPSIIFQQIIQRISNLIEDDSYLISCTKGILGKPFRPLSEVITEKVGNTLGVLSGPNLAKEIADNKVAGSVIASSDNELINSVKSVLSSQTFKIYSSNDMQGVEFAGALKNIYAIICGMADSLKVGENAIGLILSLLNKLNLANDSVKNKLWSREKFRGYEIENKTIGIIGYGNTGKSLAKKLTGFNVKEIIFYATNS